MRGTPASIWPTLLLLAAGLGAASCAESVEPPGSRGRSFEPGRYVLDREATRSALLEAAAAPDDSEVRERMGLPEDRWERKQRNQRQLAETVARGGLEQDLTFRPDGTWSGTTRTGAVVRRYAGTWRRNGDLLEVVQKEPAGADTRVCRIVAGRLEILGQGHLTVAVLRRE